MQDTRKVYEAFTSGLEQGEKYVAYLQFLGVTTFLSGVVANSTLSFLHQSTSHIALYTTYAGIAVTIIGTILAFTARSLKDATHSRIGTPIDKLTKYYSPRTTAAAAAFMAVSAGLALFRSAYAHHGSVSLSGMNCVALATLGLGLVIMTASALVAFRRDQQDPNTLFKHTGSSTYTYETDAEFNGRQKGDPRYHGSFFFSRSLCITGALMTGTGVALMSTGIWSPGVNTMLAGIGLMLTGAILDSFLSFRQKESASGCRNETLWAERIKPVSALVTTGLGIDILHQSLCSSAYHPSLANANMAAFIAMTAFTLGVTLFSRYTSNPDWMTQPARLPRSQRIPDPVSNPNAQDWSPSIPTYAGGLSDEE